MTKSCPTCKTPLEIKSPLEINQSVICPHCGLEMEVVWLYPLELAKVIDYKPDQKRKRYLKKQGR